MFLTRVTQALSDHQVPYAIVGGHAVALHGALRGTVDIDFVIRWQKKYLLQFLKILTVFQLQLCYCTALAKLSKMVAISI